jgi:hypothetical protein
MKVRSFPARSLPSSIVMSSSGPIQRRRRSSCRYQKAIRSSGSHHQVAHVLAGDAAGSGQEAHGFPITAVERKRNPHPLAVVAADLKRLYASHLLSGRPCPVSSGAISRRAQARGNITLANRCEFFNISDVTDSKKIITTLATFLGHLASEARKSRHAG